MKEQPGDNKRVDEIMNSLDGIQPATSSPYLYTKIMGRLREEESTWRTLAAFLSRPAVAVSLSLLLLFTNAWIIFNNHSSAIDEKADQLTVLAQEYNFEQPSLLDQNINQP